MSYDLGDPVPLAIIVRNTAGTPENAGTVVLTITLPDLSTTAPALSNPSAGNYNPTTPYVSTQAGRHLTRWVATGANASAVVDVFHVIAADPRFIIGLADARKALSLTAADTSKDEDLRGYISAVTPIVEDITGPVLPATKVMTVDGGTCSVVLPHRVTAVTSVVEDGITLTSGGYIANLASGIILRGTTQTVRSFAPGRQNVTVTYTVGSSVVTDAVTKAARIILRQMWQADQQGYRPNFGSPDQDTVQTPSGFLVPKRAYELLKPTPAMPGFS